MDVSTEALHGRIEDLVVVEGQFGKMVNREPGSFVSIVSAYDFGWFDQRIVGNGDDAFARITVRIGENAQFADGGSLQAGFFAQLTKSSVLCYLV